MYVYILGFASSNTQHTAPECNQLAFPGTSWSLEKHLFPDGGCVVTTQPVRKAGGKKGPSWPVFNTSPRDKCLQCSMPKP